MRRAILIGNLLAGVSLHAISATVEPAEIGVTSQDRPESLMVLDTSGTSVPIGLLDPTTRFSLLGSGSIDPRAYGAKCDGDIAHDDTAAFLSAAAAVAAFGGGTVLVPPAVCAVGASADLDLSSYSNVRLLGHPGANGYSYTPNSTPYTLLLNSAHTVKLGSHSVADGLRITRQGVLNHPKTLREAIQEKNAFIGTGLTISNQTDVQVRNVQIDGFAVGLYQNNVDRLVVDNVRGDDTKVFDLNGCYDICVVVNSEAWPFLTFEPSVFMGQQSAVSNVTNSSGLVKVTLTSSPATALVSGDIVVVYNVGGVTGANGRCTITAIDATHFTCNDSTFGGAYTSGGSVYLSSAWRSGPGFSQTSGNWETSALTEYGHDIGYYYGSGVTMSTCFSCWADGDTSNSAYMDNGTIGVDIEGTAVGVAWLGGAIISKSLSIKQNSTNGNQPSVFTGMASVGAAGAIAGVQGSAIQVLHGAAIISGGGINGLPAGTSFYWAYVADTAQSLDVSGSTLGGFANATVDPGQIALQNPADCPKVSLNGMIGPCTWMPILKGLTTAGTPTYTTQIGEYVIQGARGQSTTHGVVQAWFDVKTSALGGMAGQIIIDQLPGTNGSSFQVGSCELSRITGYVASTNYNSPRAQVGPRQNFIVLGQSSNTGFEMANVTDANISPITDFAGSCVYHQ
jgi:hypothetical protein